MPPLQRLLLRVALEAIALEMLSHRRLLRDPPGSPDELLHATIAKLNADPSFASSAIDVQAASVSKTLGRGSWSLFIARLIAGLEETGNGNDRYMSDTLRRCVTAPDQTPLHGVAIRPCVRLWYVYLCSFFVIKPCLPLRLCVCCHFEGLALRLR
jgi:hypothetical protein